MLHNLDPKRYRQSPRSSLRVFILKELNAVEGEVWFRDYISPRWERWGIPLIGALAWFKIYAPINAKPHSPPTQGRVGICHRGVAKDAPLGPKFLDNPPLTPYYSPDGYPGKAANNVKLPL